ncbi:hypothetical protein GA0115256_114971 [Streptomyces sp. DconLS]|nr:hypothetical protein GA0115256_114971 [Streptomyces sp. DconLS]SCF95710.1 hypothetical protein GA0115258_118771 [Streptomyces sp. LamerLS-31b]
MEGGDAGAPKEASARDRLAAARVRRPRRQRRPRSGTARSATAWLAAAAPWTAVAAVVVFGAFQMGLIPIPRSSPPAPAAGPASGPAEAVSLPGGGTSDGDQCGTKGYHHFPLPAGATDAEPPSPASGPQLSLSHYGYAADPGGEGDIVIGLRFTTPGTKKPLRVSRTLGGEGAAVEIEGPDGLVAGAHGLPVIWPSAARASASGASGTSGASVDVSDGGGGEIVVPAEALCPGHDGDSVARSLVPPADSTGTVTGRRATASSSHCATRPSAPCAPPSASPRAAACSARSTWCRRRVPDYPWGLTTPQAGSAARSARAAGAADRGGRARPPDRRGRRPGPGCCAHRADCR